MLKESKLLEQARHIIRTKQYSHKTELAYIDWIYRYIFFQNDKHPGKLGEFEISEFLSFLAIERGVSSSTQNQALNALVFLYKEVLKKPLGKLFFRYAKVIISFSVKK